MHHTQSATRTVDASDAGRQFDELLAAVDRAATRVIVEKGGKPVAAIVPAADLDRLNRLDAEQRDAWDVLEAVRAPFRDVPHEEIERETDRIMAEIREEDRLATVAANQ